MPRIVSSSFRVGKVQGCLRGRIWYLCYHDNRQRRRPRVGPDAGAARRLAAQTNAQLESGDIAILTFEPVAIPDLRQRWLDHHEHVLRTVGSDATQCRVAADTALAPLSAVSTTDATLQQDIVDASSTAHDIAQALQGPMKIALAIVNCLQQHAQG